MIYIWHSTLLAETSKSLFLVLDRELQGIQNCHQQLARYLKLICNFTWADMHSLMFVSCFCMYCFTFDDNSKNCSRDILKWFLYISWSSLVHSTNNVFDAPNMLRLIIHGLIHRRFFFYFFFLKCVDILLLNSHILQQHLLAQVHLPPFWNRLHCSLLWNRVNSIVQPFNSISLIPPRWSTWGTRVNAPLDTESRHF